MSLLRRRQDEKRMKRIAKNKANKMMTDATPRDIGKWYSVHGAVCSCAMCCNPRRHGQKTLSERIEDDRNKEEYLD